MSVSGTAPITPLPKPGDLSSCGRFAPLPYDIVGEIFLFLDLRSVLTMPRLNRAFYVMSNDDNLLKRIFCFYVPMAKETPEIYEKIGYKKFLTGQGWPILFAVPRITMSFPEKMVNNCYSLAAHMEKDAGPAEKFNPITWLFQFSLFLFDTSYLPTITQKAHDAMKLFHASLEQDKKMIEQLDKRLKAEDWSLQHKRSETIFMKLLHYKVGEIKTQFESNPRWHSPIENGSIIIRQPPATWTRKIPPMPTNSTLLTINPVSEIERQSFQEEVGKLRNQITVMQQLLSAQQPTATRQYPQYKKILNLFLYSVATALTIITVSAIFALLGGILLFALYLFFKETLNFFRK